MKDLDKENSNKSLEERLRDAVSSWDDSEEIKMTDFNPSDSVVYGNDKPIHLRPEEIGRLTPREEFEEIFGAITDDKWEWLKEFGIRNPVTGAPVRNLLVIQNETEHDLVRYMMYADYIVLNREISVRKVEGLRFDKVYFTHSVLANGMDDSLLDVLYRSLVLSSIKPVDGFRLLV